MNRALLTLCVLCASVVNTEAAAKPNILFIAMDDLNDWVGCLGGHPQARTPNLDRLAASGILFSNAHCAAPSCNPSRTAIFTGLSPHRSGIYRNNQKMREALPTTEILPKTFSRAGYWAAARARCCTTSSMPVRGMNIFRRRKPRVLSRARSIRSSAP